MILPKIIFPSQPAIPPIPVAGYTTGGALPARTYYIVVCWVTALGVTLPSEEVSALLPLGTLCQVGPISAPNPPTYAVGWNVYASTTEGGEVLQNSSPLALGAIWTEYSSGLVTGTSTPPSTWGATLNFTYQPRQVPYDIPKAFRKDSFSTAGWRQAVTERVEHHLTLNMQWVLGGADAASWSEFLNQATQGVPFDYYPDSTQPTYTTYSLVDMTKPIAYKSPNIYTFNLTFRKEFQQVQPPVGVVTTPVSAVKKIPFTTTAPGPFSLAHGLGYTPNYFGVPKLQSLGDVVYGPQYADGINLYLQASAAGLSGYVEAA